MLRLIRSLNKSNDNPLGLLKNSQGQYVDNPDDTVHILMERFFPNHKNVSNDLNRQVCQTVRHLLLNHSVFTVNKVKTALKSFGPLKAAGPDKLKPIVLQHLTNKGYKILTHIHRASFSTGYIPEKWRVANVVFIPKPNKNYYG